MPSKFRDPDEDRERLGYDKPWPDEEKGYLDEQAERHHPLGVNRRALDSEGCYSLVPQASDGLTDEQQQAYVDAAAHAQEGAPYVAPELHRVAVLAQQGNDEFCAACGKRFHPGEDVMVSMPDGEFRHDECVEEDAGDA